MGNRVKIAVIARNIYTGDAARYNSIEEAAEELNVSCASISKCVKHERLTACGYSFTAEDKRWETHKAWEKEVIVFDLKEDEAHMFPSIKSATPFIMKKMNRKANTVTEAITAIAKKKYKTTYFKGLEIIVEGMEEYGDGKSRANKST